MEEAGHCVSLWVPFGYKTAIGNLHASHKSDFYSGKPEIKVSILDFQGEELSIFGMNVVFVATHSFY